MLTFDLSTHTLIILLFYYSFFYYLLFYYFYFSLLLTFDLCTHTLNSWLYYFIILIFYYFIILLLYYFIILSFHYFIIFTFYYFSLNPLQVTRGDRGVTRALYTKYFLIAFLCSLLTKHFYFDSPLALIVGWANYRNQKKNNIILPYFCGEMTDSQNQFHNPLIYCRMQAL